MKYLIILALCVFATCKISFQGAFGKNNVKTSADAIIFNFFVFVFSALMFLPKVFSCTPVVWVYAGCAAFCTVLYQMFYTKALATGSLSLTVLIVNFNTVVCVLVSYFIYNEPISFVRLIGILLTAICFVVCTRFDDDKTSQKNWLLYTVLALLSCTLGTLAQKVFGESPYSSESPAFISCMYVIAALFSVMFYGFLRVVGDKVTIKISFNMLKLALAVGVSLALYQLVNTYALANIDGTFLFPAYIGGSIIFSTATGVLIFKDVLTKKQIAGIIIGIVATVLMNF